MSSINRATIALHAYYCTDPTGDDSQTTLVDLLTDLQHYAASTPTVDFAAALETARNHYKCESGREPV